MYLCQDLNSSNNKIIMKLKLYIIIIVVMINCLPSFSQIKKELMTEENGFKWHMLKTDHQNWLGAADYNGKIIIPAGRYWDVMYLCVDGVGYFCVQKKINDKLYVGACDYTGKEIIPCKYSMVTFYNEEKFFKCTDYADKEYIIPMDIDRNGNVIMPRKSYSSSNSNNSSSELRYKGIYTISSQGRSQTYGGYTGVAGPDIETVIEIYDDYIMIGTEKCKFNKVQGGEKVYVSSGWGFGGSNTYSSYYVNSNYNIRRVDTFSNQFGTDWFEYEVVKGRCTMPKYQPQFGGSSSSGGGGSTYGSGGSNYNQNQTGKKGRTACRSCMYTNGKCSVCKGTGRQTSSAVGYSTKTQCRNCGGSGRCPTCGGDGWID